MTILYEVENNLYMNITNRCPCSCIFCIRKNGDGAYGSDSLWLEHEPSVAEIKSCIDNTDLSNYDEIVICGYGEPTERLDILTEICAYIKTIKNAPIIRINTNGLSDLINCKETAHLFSGLIDTVSISLNAGANDEYMRVTNPKFGDKSYEAMLKFAEDCKKYVPKVIFTVVDIISEEQISLAKDVADRMGIPLRIRKYQAD